MTISSDSQLGLKFKDPIIQTDFLKLMRKYLEEELGLTRSFIKQVEDLNEKGIIVTKENAKELLTVEHNNEIDYLNSLSEDNLIRDKIIVGVGEVNIISSDDSKYFLIQSTVFKAAELIKISDNFTGRTLKDIKFGKYTYLLGKNKMIRFVVVPNFIKGFYYDNKNNIAFEWGIELEDGKYYFQNGYNKEFSMIMQLLTFIELGDIEVKILESLKNDGGKRNDKIYNASLNTVFVVDSTWNQILMRTEGFAVRGHFRLQSCGPQGIDRKLIWINAFEKDGYTRKPKATIIH